MPTYPDITPYVFYPSPEERVRQLHASFDIRSILDCGAGRGGVFDSEFWTRREMSRRVATDLFWIKPMPEGWEAMTGVDVQALPFADGEFDFVQCCEVLEHVPDTRKALEELCRVARRMVFITSADETAHKGEEQAAFEALNPHQAYLGQPRIEDLKELGFDVRVEETERRQIIAWLYK